MIDAIVFDFDGVIIDTETPDYETWAEVFESHGVELHRSLWIEFIGSGVYPDVYGHLERLTGSRVDRDDLRESRRVQFLERIEANPLLPGILDRILEAKELGLKLGVASSSNRSWVVGHLEQRGLLHHFDAIRTRDDVAEVKPHPELYVTAVSWLQSEPHRAIAIEDSAHGITAAKNAGLFCVAVPNPMTHDLPIDHANLRLESLAEISLSELMTRADE